MTFANHKKQMKLKSTWMKHRLNDKVKRNKSLHRN